VPKSKRLVISRQGIHAIKDITQRLALLSVQLKERLKFTFMKTYTRFLLVALFAIPTLLIAQAPTVTFTATPASVCACSNVTFTNNTTNSPTQWKWYFPGGSPSSWTGGSPGNPPPIMYCNTGNYTVSCVVTNGFGSDSK
jgi:PKD repeat protein